CGVLAAVAIPGVNKITRMYMLRAAAREVYSDLQSARLGAVMGNHRYRVVLVDSTTYQLHDDTDNDGTVDAGETVLTRSLAADAPGVALSGTSPITFLADGTVLSAGTLTVTQTATTNYKVATIAITAGGKVKITYPTS